MPWDFPERYATRIPPRIIEGLRHYIEEGRPVGHFLAAVLSNDLTDSIGRADDDSLRALKDIVELLYNYAPHVCWGSPEAVGTWLQKHDQERREREAQAIGQ